MGILDNVKAYPELSHIVIDRLKLMRSLGIDLTTREYVVLSNLTMEEVSELPIKSLMWLETVNEVLSTTKKLYLDQDLETEGVTAEVVSSLLAADDKNYKVTEARALAKVHPDYIASAKKLNTLVAYVGYLERLIENLNKYHYTVKSRIELMQHVERKY